MQCEGSYQIHVSAIPTGSWKYWSPSILPRVCDILNVDLGLKSELDLSDILLSGEGQGRLSLQADFTVIRYNPVDHFG